MDDLRFDRLVADASRRPSRRAALRLFAGGLFGGLLAARGATARAQRADSDGDGLFDDDETGVYGTDPGFYDSDGDGFGDGEEVYYGSNPLVIDGAVTGDGNLGAADPGPAGTFDPANATVCLGVGGICADDAACCPGTRCCIGQGGFGLDLECTDVSATGGFCPGSANGGTGIVDASTGIPIGPATGEGTGIGIADPIVCLMVGAYCDYDTQCCGSGVSVQCCFDSVTLRTRCEDISARGACLEQ